jgi:Protein of unknown function (DUF3277)
MTPFTYSFLDVNAAIVGPGGSFPLGSEAGVAEEGISVEPSAEIDVMTIGADGSGMHSLIANKGAKITIRLLKTSPTNALLMMMQSFQRASGANHGQNTVTITNKVSGDVITAQQVAFAKVPNIAYAKEGGTIEWEFNAILTDVGLGAGVAA